MPDRALIIPPNDIISEHAVLACLMLESGSIDQISGLIKSEDFYEPRNALIFETIKKLKEAGEAYDVIMTAAAMRSAGELEKIGGESYLMEVARIVPNAGNLGNYVRNILEKSLLRKLFGLSGFITEKVFEYDRDLRPALHAVDECSQKIYELSRNETSRELEPFREILMRVYDNLQKVSYHKTDLLGVTTGYERLNKLINGLQKSSLIIVAGRPGIGKTSFAMNMAQNAAEKAKKTVAIFSLEMSAEQIVHKFISCKTGISGNTLQSGPLRQEVEWKKLANAGDPLGELNVYIDDSSKPTAMEIASKCRRLKTSKGLDLIVIDYLQLMTSESKRRSDNRTNEVSEITRSLKAMAKDLEVPVVALSQLNRGPEDRKEKRPLLSDLRESGSIEQDADQVLFIHRPNYYTKEFDTSADGEAAEVIIGKNRTGPQGTVNLTYIPYCTKFQEQD
ncbi:MAG: replicative DNA helicase [Deferribacteraceae bacterium]|jgi:replicative DNA helicase|nr:replicative DNA helicase [Deferribacteraceae bacterium]